MKKLTVTTLLLAAGWAGSAPAYAGPLKIDWVGADAKWIIHVDVEGFTGSIIGSGLLALVAVVASLDLGQPAPPVSPSVDAPRARPVAIVIGFDPSRYDGLKQKILQRLKTSVEAQLVAEARQIFDDARAAGEIVLARLPLPAVRVETVPEGNGENGRLKP